MTRYDNNSLRSGGSIITMFRRVLHNTASWACDNRNDKKLIEVCPKEILCDNTPGSRDQICYLCPIIMLTICSRNV